MTYSEIMKRLKDLCDPKALAKEIRGLDSKAAKWFASDALRELTGNAAQKRLKEKAERGRGT